MVGQAVAVLVPMHPGECHFWVGVQQPNELQHICMPGPADTMSKVSPFNPENGLTQLRKFVAAAVSAEHLACMRGTHDDDRLLYDGLVHSEPSLTAGLLLVCSQVTRSKQAPYVQ